MCEFDLAGAEFVARDGLVENPISMRSSQGTSPSEEVDQVVVPSPKGGKRSGAGRPATGKTWEAFALKLKHEDAAELRRRAKSRGIPVSEFIRKIVLYEIRPRPSRTRRSGRKG